LKFNRSFEKLIARGVAPMGWNTLVLTAARSDQGPANHVSAQQVPWALKLLGKFVVEVLPAAVASTIGAFLLAHYQFAHVSQPGTAAAVAAPASGQMLQLVHEEHDMIRDFLVAEEAAEKSRTTGAFDNRAAADPKLADAQPADVKPAEVKPVAPAARHVAALAPNKPTARPTASTITASAATGGTVPAALPPVVVAAAAPVNASVVPPPTAHASLVSTTLAVPGHVVSMTLHAVMSIGGIPSWIGHRVGAADLDSEAAPAGTAS
jgi:hypothetical protein